MKRNTKHTKSHSLASFKSLEIDITPWSPPVPIQTTPRFTQQFPTNPPKVIGKHSRTVSLGSTASFAFTDITFRTQQSAEVVQPSPRFMRAQIQAQSSMSLKDLDNFTTTLYRMPALSRINEGADDMFDPLSLVNYEELDDYLLSIKARHQPESRISVKEVNQPSNNSKVILSPRSESSILSSSQDSPRSCKSPEISRHDYGGSSWCCSEPRAKKVNDSISLNGTKGLRF